MLTPARSAPPPEPDDPEDDPHRRGRGTGLTAGRGRRAGRGSLLVLAALAALAAVAFPLAPVVQPEVTYSWPGNGSAGNPTAAAIPLLPYQPAALTASVSCAAARAGGDGGVLLATVPARPDPAALPLAGLRIVAAGDALRVSSAGLDLGEVALPAGDCTVTVVSDPAGTQVLLDGVAVLSRDGDVRPDVAGVFTDSADTTGLALSLVTDTRFQTRISAAKATVGVVAVLSLVGALVVLGRLEGRTGRAGRRTGPRLLPRGWWRPRPVDAVVAGGLAVWWLVGPPTVDDGYIAGIVRGRGANGVVGNVYRWLNAPEAPFSWFYDLYAAWSWVSTSTLWMRLPSTLLGLLCWWMLSRLVVPRLGRFAARRPVPWLAALAFATWWVPFNLGLRPEPWVAVGGLAVFLAVERAVATRRVRPLAAALVLAGATAALTPAGLMAFAPLIAAAPPLLRLLRARTDLHAAPLVAVLVAAPASALLLMFADQSLAAVLEATRVRALVGGGLPWHQEVERYAALLEPRSFQGAIGRRAAVLLTLLAAAGVAWSLRGRPLPGIAAGPARRLVLGFVLALASLTLSPTKWTQHFGDLAGQGAAVLLLGLVAWSAPGLARRAGTRARAAGIAAVAVGSGLVLAGYNSWPYVGDWYTPTWSTVPPTLAGTALASVALAAGGAFVLALLARDLWWGADGAAPDPPAGTGPGAREVPVHRWAVAPSGPVAVVLVAVLALQVLGHVRIAVTQRDGYTLAADAAATLAGEPCGLPRLLDVETDPSAGTLPALTGPPATTRPATVDLGGVTGPGVVVSGTGRTPWLALEPAQRDGELPVVVTVAGPTRPGDGLAVEFGRPAGEGGGDPAAGGAGPGEGTAGGAEGDGVVTARVPLVGTGPDPADQRLIAPPGAEAVRLVVDAPAPPGPAPAVASLPRAPRLSPMTEVLPAGTTAILDWPVAFVFPCLEPAALPLGTAELPGWRVGPPAADPAAGITYSPGFGGPFATARLLVTERRMPTYLRGEPTRDAAQVHRWVPVTELARPEPVVAGRTVPGWHADGRTRVPGLDPVG